MNHIKLRFSAVQKHLDYCQISKQPCLFFQFVLRRGHWIYGLVSEHNHTRKHIEAFEVLPNRNGVAPLSLREQGQ
jgi:hemerythrin-like domain-containing protein